MMSKSMIIFDTPEYCGKCPCYEVISSKGVGMCEVKSKTTKAVGARPSWCPALDLDMPRTNALIKVLREPLYFHGDPISYVEERAIKRGDTE